MKYIIYIISMFYGTISFAQKEIDITKDVIAGDTDIQNASTLIEAHNKVENNAIAIYKSLGSILLSDGFFADGGSNVFMAIEDNMVSSLGAKDLESNLTDTDFYVSPNPSSGLFEIQSANQVISYSVTNLLGEKIVVNTVNDNQFTLDITEFSKGFYLLEAEKENGEIIRKKIIKN